jgi:hypothetical protein
MRRLNATVDDGGVLVVSNKWVFIRQLAFSRRYNHESVSALPTH